MMFWQKILLMSYVGVGISNCCQVFRGGFPLDESYLAREKTTLLLWSHNSSRIIFDDLDEKNQNNSCPSIIPTNPINSATTENPIIFPLNHHLETPPPPTHPQPLLLLLLQPGFVDFLYYIHRTLTATSPLLLVLFTLYLYFTGTLFFDIAHYTLHRLSKSPHKLLRRIAYLHEVHHLYFNRRLKFNNRYLWANTLFELPLELSCQVFGTYLGYILAKAFKFTGPGFMSKELLSIVVLFEVIRSVVVAIMEGRDSNHQTYTTVPKDPSAFFVGPEYHALHHVDPTAYFGSTFRVLDWVLGSSYTLRSRRVAVFGVEREFAMAMEGELAEKEKVNCVRYLGDFRSGQEVLEVLGQTDILIVGFERQEFRHVAEIVERYKQYYTPRSGNSLLLPEVWLVDHTSHSRSTSVSQSPEVYRGVRAQSREWHDDENFVFRQINVSKRRSGSTLWSGVEVKVALWWIRRGARFVPLPNPVTVLKGYLAYAVKWERWEPISDILEL